MSDDQSAKLAEHLAPSTASAAGCVQSLGEGNDFAVVIVHSLAHAVGALRAAARSSRPVILASAPGAGGYAGPGWFGGVIVSARETVPDARCFAKLDCGDWPGAILAAIRAGIEGVVFTGRADVGRRLAEIANRHGVRLFTKRAEVAIDLGEIFFASEQESEERCAAFFVRCLGGSDRGPPAPANG